MKLCMNVSYISNMADRNFGFNWLSIVAATGIFQKFNDNKGLGFLIAHTQAIKINQPIKI